MPHLWKLLIFSDATTRLRDRPTVFGFDQKRNDFLRFVAPPPPA